MSAKLQIETRASSLLSSGLGGYALLGAGISLAGWFAHLPRLTDWDGSGISMFANTAVMAATAGAALILQTVGRPWASTMCRALGAIVALIGAATLFQHFTGINLGIDTLLVREPWGTRASLSPGRPGLPASLSFTLLGISLVLATGGPRARAAVPVLGVVVLAIALPSLIGYLFGADPLFSIARLSGIAMQTATMILALALGMIAVVPEHQPLRTLCENSAAGALARCALPFVFGLPIVLGWLRLLGQRAGFYDLSMGTALLVLALIAVLCTLLWCCVVVVGRREEIVRLKEAALLREIADRERAEEQLHEAAQRAKDAAHAKDNFLAALSHELRTPLTPALMAAAALEHDSTLPEEVREQLAMIHRNIQVQRRLIDDLLDLTRVSHGKLKIEPIVTDLHEMLEQAQDTIHDDLMARRIEYHVALEASEHHVMADPTRLQQVFWNLLKNAVKFTPVGGAVTVRSLNPGPGRVAVCVEDNGMGIAPEALARIFRPFDQGELEGRREFSGLGLGLSISKVIVDLHGGELRAASEGRGKGALFTVELNTAAIPKAATIPDGPAPPLPPVPSRMLIVEDHEPTLAALSRLLEKDGHRVFQARTVNEALAHAAANPCDIVISDLGLPDGTGFELMSEIRRRYGWPGIALSGHGMEADLRMSAESGFTTHLIKPVDPSQLREAIQMTLDARELA
jgi:signal transduction histidine kinase